MHTRNLIKFPCTILLLVSTNLKRAITLSWSSVIPFQLSNRLSERATSFVSHYYKCLSSIRTIIKLSNYNIEPKFGGLRMDPLEHMFMLNKLLFSCKLFTNIYLSNNKFNIYLDINRTYKVAIWKISKCTISTTRHNRKIYLIFKFNFRTIRKCISGTHTTLSGDASQD